MQDKGYILLSKLMYSICALSLYVSMQALNASKYALNKVKGG